MFAVSEVGAISANGTAARDDGAAELSKFKVISAANEVGSLPVVASKAKQLELTGTSVTEALGAPELQSASHGLGIVNGSSKSEFSSSATPSYSYPKK